MGLHISGELLSDADDRRISERAAKADLSVPALSTYYGGPPTTRGFVMGYGHLTPAQIRSGVTLLAAILQPAKRLR